MLMSMAEGGTSLTQPMYSLASIIRAASAMKSGSLPKICTAMGSSLAMTEAS